MQLIYKEPTQSDSMDFPSIDHLTVAKVGPLIIGRGICSEEGEPICVVIYVTKKYEDPLYFFKYAKYFDDNFDTFSIPNGAKIHQTLRELGFVYENNGAYNEYELADFEDEIFILIDEDEEMIHENIIMNVEVDIGYWASDAAGS